MPKVCNYSITISGSADELAAIRALLSDGLVRTEGGVWGDQIIDLDVIYPDIDIREEQSFIGITGEMVNEEVPGGQRLCFRGASEELPPVSMAVRLSRQYPSIQIDVSGTFEEEEYFDWTVRDGRATLVDQCFYLDHDTDRIRWRVEDGIELPDPPELLAWLSQLMDGGSAISGEDGVNDMTAFEAELDALCR